MNRGLVGGGLVAVLLVVGAVLWGAMAPSEPEAPPVPTPRPAPKKTVFAPAPSGGGPAGAPAPGGSSAAETPGADPAMATDGGAPNPGAADGLVASDATPAVAEPTVWPVSRDGIQGAMAEAVPGVRDCYDSLLRDTPGVEGKISVAFTITDDDGVGKVTIVDVPENTSEDGELEACVLDAVDTLQFDLPEGGGQMTVNYPFVFESAGGAVD